MKLITGNDPVRDKQAIAGMYLVVFALIAGGVWMAFKEQWWAFLMSIAAALILILVCIDAQRQMNTAYQSVDIQKLYMKGWILAGPDWLFWSILLPWLVGAALGGGNSVYGLMFCAFFLKANHKRLHNALNRFFPFSKIRNTTARHFVFVLPDILYWTLMVCAVAILLISHAFHFQAASDLWFEIGLGAWGLAILLLIVDHCFYKNRRHHR